MGTENLYARSGGQTVEAEDVNQYRKALSGDIVPRTSGNPVNEAGSLGQSGLCFLDIHFNGRLIQNGNVIRTELLQNNPNEITSGKAKTSGYPDFLAIVAASTSGKILGATTPLELAIDQILVSVTTDITIAGLATAPSSNNTCLVNDAALTGADSTKWLGEAMEALQIDTVGSEISNLNGTVQVFETSGGEYFLAYIDTTRNQLFPYRRGMGGSARSTLSNNDTLTLRKANHIFIDADAVTAYQTTIMPSYGPTDPVSGTNGQFFYNTTTKKWRRYNSSWSDENAHYLGFFICNTTQSVAAQCNDFAKNWTNNANGFMSRVDSDTVRVIVDSINIAGTDFEILNFGQLIQLSASGDRESGQSEDASTTYYIYMDNNLKCRFSKTAPRAIEHRHALYHPYEYWRYLGYCVNDSASNIGEVRWQATESTFGKPSGAWRTGNIKVLFDTVAEDGFLLLDGSKSIGNPASGATGRANADALHLFIWLWNRTTNSICQLQTSAGVSQARGATAIADWEANRRLVLPEGRGRKLQMIDGTANTVTSASTGGANADVLGGLGGEENHTQTTGELRPHDHDFSYERNNGNSGSLNAGAKIDSTGNTKTTQSTGGGNPFSVMDPYIVVNFQIKL